jgi:hypothetical protein
MPRTMPPILPAIALAIALAMTSEGFAQGARRYQPSRPTVSPYLNLYRNNVGPLPNYYSLVRPQLNQQTLNDRVLAQQAQQSATLGVLQSQSAQSTVTPTGKRSWFMTYGRQTFMTPAPSVSATGR